MARLSTCKGCGKKLQPEEKHLHSSKVYCIDCYKKIKQESDEYKQLIDFICTNYQIEQPTGFMLKQIKELRTECSYSYAAMTYTLWYCKEVLGKQLIEKYGVALIRNFYNEACDYYNQQERMKEQMKKIENVQVKTKVVKRQSNQLQSQKSSLINLGNLLEGGDAH